MKRNYSIYAIAIFLFLFNCKDESKEQNIETSAVTETTNALEESNVKVIPINHGTLILEGQGQVIYVDPVGGAEAFTGQNKPTIILITDIHGDHLNVDTLEALDKMNAEIIVPQAVADRLPESLSGSVKIMNNGDKISVNNIEVEAIPMYNLREEAKNFHTKGRGNGYVLNLENELIYISGDTEDIPEMRNLENIDKAFVCMNLPYTMTVQSAASAVIDFKPKKVYPYHYRGSDGLSNVEAFKTLVNKGAPSVEVVQFNWYK